MQTSLEPELLEKVILGKTGLEFEAETGVDSEGQRWYLLRPRGLTADHTFGIRTTLGWRRLRMDFEPGKFAGSLLVDMSKADADGRSAFLAVLHDCRRLGSQINLEINGVPVPFDSEVVWAQTWNRLVLSINKGQVELARRIHGCRSLTVDFTRAWAGVRRFSAPGVEVVSVGGSGLKGLGFTGHGAPAVRVPRPRGARPASGTGRRRDRPKRSGCECGRPFRPRGRRS